MKNKIINFFQNEEIKRLKNEIDNKESEITQLNKKIDMLEELNILNFIRAEEIYTTSNTNENEKIKDLANAIVVDIKESSKVICNPLLNLIDFVKQSINNSNIFEIKLQDNRRFK